MPGQPGFLTGVSLDITERKNADERFRLVVEASPSAIVLVNRQGEIQLINTLVETLFGYRSEDLIGQSVELLVPERFRGSHPNQRAAFHAGAHARMMGVGRELFARRKDGSEFPVEIRLTPVSTEQGSLVLCTVTDITERMRTTVELHRHRQELAHVSRLSVLGELSASMAHELNQPLTAILSNAQAAQRFMAAGQPDLVELREILQDIVQDTGRARDVIRQLRSLVHKSERQFVYLDVNESIRQVIGFLHGDIVSRNVSVAMELAPALPVVSGDRVQLQQVLLNLLLNAFDAMISNPVAERRATVLTLLESPDMIRVTVHDRGTGIAVEKLGMLFDAFYTTKAHGLGMGLSVSRSIVEAHGGRIWAENNADGGASFHFTLPVAGEKSNGT
jgi:PAS domain S-box-containing protein